MPHLCYLEYKIKFYERQFTKIVFVFLPFCEIPNFTPVLPQSSKRHFTVLKAPSQGSVAALGQQGVSGRVGWQQIALKQMSHSCVMFAVFL